ncbi:sigma 54-interacting transcriptional regulator [Alkalihalophilus pseudofirmus]|uniref:Sigma 54-interacting transcriptional regulator n=2 Tax=Alkalihalophilus pseudofirmus TaxID=79885 RepID=A0AAJ2NRE3_ALKPS|nr:sigma 54-interacting transcriptional regulator [Alkalihalophilus pseudofirmus]
MMKQNKIVLVAGSIETKEALSEQLHELIGDFIQVESYAVDDDFLPLFTDQLILLSSNQIKREINEHLGENCSIIIAKRIINFSSIETLFLIPEGENVLYVNDFPETVEEALASVDKFGVQHLNFIPYDPSKLLDPKIKIAVTPGELDLVPDTIETVINLGPRLIDMSTMITILTRFSILEAKLEAVSDRYLQTITRLSQKLRLATSEANRSTDHLKTVVDGVDGGILAIKQGNVTVINEVAEKILGLRRGQALNRRVGQFIKDHELLYFISNADRADDLINIRDQEILVHKFLIEPDQTIVLTLKNVSEERKVEQSIRRDLKKKGHLAKYTFKQIVGEHQELKATKVTASKLAKTDLTVLIEGESGTGKELFASSIHMASNRSKGPFLAINFSALPEDLVESELFGYEEGAFTGAKKGGKKGLFEQANGGTIFLDEIGDISLKVQARLLRVLQERELLRIGGEHIIPIDVRVVAATNKNLLNLIDAGEFREDLYHRLKVLYLHLPELRNRYSDISLLVRHFLHEQGLGHVKVEKEVIDILKEYPWYGNVRELKNTIDYMLAVSEDSCLTVDDIPEERFFQRKPVIVKERLGNQEIERNTQSEKSFTKEELQANPELLFILRTLQGLQQKGEGASRKKVADLSKLHFQYELTEQQVRHRLELLEEEGYIKKRRGRFGTRIMPKGEAVLRSTPSL